MKDGFFMVSSNQFQGFSQEIFDSCEASHEINNVREALEQLRLVIQPEMKKLNPKLNGKVSEAKQRKHRGIDWTDWGWLMFTLAPLGTKGSSRPGKPVGAGKLTQLTVNISKNRLFIGLWLRTSSDRNRLQRSLISSENEELFNNIIRSLFGRRWIITQVNEPFGEKRARYFSEDELRGKLLNPRLDWINSSFSRHDDIVSKTDISTEIVEVFTELFNLFALATGIPTNVQPPSASSPPRVQKVLVDKPALKVASDEEEIQNALDFLAKLELKDMPSAINAPKRVDSYPVERIVLPLKLRPRIFQHSSGSIMYWLDSKYSEVEIVTREELLKQLRSKLDQFAVTLGTSPDFLQIMVTSPQTDARYTKSNRILINLMRYERNRMMEFWLFAIAREIAYLRYKRLSYRHITFMRKVLLAFLSRLSDDKLTS